MTDNSTAQADRPFATRASRGLARVARPIGGYLLQLAALLLGISTLLFFLLRLTGDPAAVLAGENADPAFLEAVRHQYGFDRPLPVQYLQFLEHAVRLDFGTSVQSGQDALGLVLERVPWTLELAVIAIVINTIIAVPLGAWIGSRPDRPLQTGASAFVFIGQGVPGYVVGLLLIQIFAVKLRWLPSIGNVGSLSWLLPSLTLAAFLVPRLTRVLSANVSDAMQADYVRTARANGAPERTALLRHALPNALLGATALVGGQFAFLLSGALITEVVFAWPGLGLLLINSVRQLDFPVVQAAVFVVAGLVFLANVGTELLFAVIDPRLKRQQA